MGGDGLPGPTDAWITLARAGPRDHDDPARHAVTSATFRLPGPLAISVAQVDADERRPGRARHRRRLVRAPSTRRTASRSRRRRALRPPRGAARDRHRPLGHARGRATFAFDGAHYRLADSPALPKPVQRPHPPVIIGGGGAGAAPRRWPRGTPTSSTSPFDSVEAARTPFARVRAGVRGRVGRDADPLVLLATRWCSAAARDEAELARRAAAIGRERRRAARRTALAGTPQEVVDRIGRYAERRRRRASTCRCSTSPTSTTSTSWRRRSCRTSEGTPGAAPSPGGRTAASRPVPSRSCAS